MPQQMPSVVVEDFQCLPIQEDSWLNDLDNGDFSDKVVSARRDFVYCDEKFLLLVYARTQGDSLTAAIKEGVIKAFAPEGSAYIDDDTGYRATLSVAAALGDWRLKSSQGINVCTDRSVIFWCIFEVDLSQFEWRSRNSLLHLDFRLPTAVPFEGEHDQDDYLSSSTVKLDPFARASPLPDSGNESDLHLIGQLNAHSTIEVRNALAVRVRFTTVPNTQEILGGSFNTGPGITGLLYNGKSRVILASLELENSQTAGALITCDLRLSMAGAKLEDIDQVRDSSEVISLQPGEVYAFVYRIIFERDPELGLTHGSNHECVLDILVKGRVHPAPSGRLSILDLAPNYSSHFLVALPLDHYLVPPKLRVQPQSTASNDDGTEKMINGLIITLKITVDVESPWHLSNESASSPYVETSSRREVHDQQPESNQIRVKQIFGVIVNITNCTETVRRMNLGLGTAPGETQSCSSLLVGVDNNVRVGPLAHGQTQSVVIRMIALAPGQHMIPSMVIEDLFSGKRTVINTALDVFASP